MKTKINANFEDNFVEIKFYGDLKAVFRKVFG